MVVSDEDGRPVKGARILISRVPEFTVSADSRKLVPVRPQPGSNRSVDTDAAGVARVDALPPGEYRACVIAGTLGVLDPCIWSGVAKFSVTPGQKTAYPTIRLQKGGIVQVRLLDPSGLLPKTDSITNPTLIVGVRSPSGGFKGMRAGEVATPEGKAYLMTVPAGVPLKLWLFGRTLRLTDERGSPVDNVGANIPFSVGLGETKTFTFEVGRLTP